MPDINTNSDKVLQHFFPTIYFDKLKQDAEYKKSIEGYILKGVGGFYISPTEVSEISPIIEQLRALAETPLIFIAEIKSGIANVLPDGTDFPHISAIAETDDLPTAFKIGQSIAKEALEIGINWLILDISEPYNKKSQKNDIKFSQEFQRGLHSKKIVTSSTDKAYEYGNKIFQHNYKKISNLTEQEYIKISNTSTAIICEELPSFTKEPTAEILTISETAYNKLITLKRRVGLLPRFAKLEKVHSTITANQNLALKVALSACKVTDKKNFLPINEECNTAVFAFIEEDADLRSATRFYTMMSQAGDNECDYAYLDLNISKDDIKDIQKQLQENELTIFLSFYREILNEADIKKIGASINGLSTGNCILFNFGNPGNSELICNNNNLITYSNSFPSLAAAVTVLFGRQEAVEKYY